MFGVVFINDASKRVYVASTKTFDSFLLFRTLMNCDVSMATALSQSGGSRQEFHTHRHSPDTHWSDWCMPLPQDPFTHEHLWDSHHAVSFILILTVTSFELKSESTAARALRHGRIISMLLREVCGIISEVKHLPGQSVCYRLYITVMLWPSTHYS